jgi:multidrug efflux pump
MNISAPFIKRPVGTSLLTIALLLAGGIAFRFLPVSPLPQVEFPVIQVQAGLPGASPETMASAVATPLERQFGRIAGITQMTSTSQLGSTSVSLQFDLSRNIDAAARDVQAAINAARGHLPSNLPNNPSYRKSNPADAPILILALTSDTITRPKIYDIADSVLGQKLAQVEGVGQVFVGGGAKPAVRVELNPTLLYKLGVGLDSVRTALGAANANRPKGQISGPINAWAIQANDQIYQADDYRKLIVGTSPNGVVRLGDVGDVQDSVEDTRNAGIANGKPAVLVIVSRQPGANIIETVDRVRALLPRLQASISPAIHVGVVMDRTITIRSSVRDTELTLLLSIVLVVMVVFVFLRSLRATLIPSISVPLSLIGTFAVMYLLGYSVDNLSLMALAISTGFVVDDAIVVLENITRYIEKGMDPVQAAYRGAREIGFTVLSMSTSLIAVFIPILLMAGIVGRLFREFAVTLSVAIGVSLLVSLTTTPMLCAKFLRPDRERKHGRIYRTTERIFDGMLHLYERCLQWVLRHQPLTLGVTLATAALSVYLYFIVPKGFFPQQDTGRLGGSVQAAQDISFEALRAKMQQYIDIVTEDKAVETAVGFAGGGGTSNTGRMFITLKPLQERKISADQVIARLRGKLAVVPGASLFLQSAQDLQIGGRQSNAQFQYTLQADQLSDLNHWSPLVLQKLRSLPQLKDVNTDQQNRGLQTYVQIDRATASRLGVAPDAIDNALYDAFGQRQVSTMYRQLNQYHVVMEVDPIQRNIDALHGAYVRSTNGGMVPLASMVSFAPSNTSLAVNHQGQVPSVTISFNLAPGVALGDATKLVEGAMRAIGVPSSVRGGFQGTAAAFQDSLSTQGILILAALLTVYIVLGVLYESYIHPITILSTLPSAGVGALLALLITQGDLNVIAMIGILLLIGIVKKNAIMMIDFALHVERTEGKNPTDAIYEACVMRFRPIMMTTMAALLGGLPLALGTGVGSELRRPLGTTIVGGLILSQLLTLFTTPVVYVYMDRMSLWVKRWWGWRAGKKGMPEGHPGSGQSGPSFAN